jgi:hypothetical protein
MTGVMLNYVPARLIVIARAFRLSTKLRARKGPSPRRQMIDCRLWVRWHQGLLQKRVIEGTDVGQRKHGTFNT